MSPVERKEILDWVTYEGQREEIRARILPEKELRRVHVGTHLTLLFENTDTVRYQVQEMVRAERIVREADILHEIATYNELLGGPGELGCTLLIEIDDPAERARRLAAWVELPWHAYVRVSAAAAAQGARAEWEKVYARFDERQVGRDRLSSVQYLKFPVGGRTPIAVGVDLPGLESETPLKPEQQAALGRDLGRS